MNSEKDSVYLMCKHAIYKCDILHSLFALQT